MRTAPTTRRYKLLLLLLGLVLIALCKPADGRKQTTGTASAIAADSGAKTAGTAKVKKARKHKKTRRAKTRAAKRSTAKRQTASGGTVQISAPAVSVAKHAGGKLADDKSAQAGANATGSAAFGAMDNATGEDWQTDTLAAPTAITSTAISSAGAQVRAFQPAKPTGAASANATAAASVLAAAPKAGDRWIEPRTGMAFRYIPAGCFTMGSPKTEHGRERDEGPRHKVCVSGFWIGETEVTQGQWTAIMENNPSLMKNGDDQPVDMISWDMAKKYAKALGAGGQQTFRLPTEAEWEYACRAGTTTAYSFGDAITHDQASFDKPFVLPAQPLEPRRKSRSRRHHDVPQPARGPGQAL